MMNKGILHKHSWNKFDCLTMNEIQMVFSEIVSEVEKKHKAGFAILDRIITKFVAEFLNGDEFNILAEDFYDK